MAPPGGRTRRATKAEVVGAAVRGGTGLMLVMVLQRGMNFVLNQLLLRHVDPAVFGIASIPLDLLLNTALFLSREGFRLALGRRTLVGVPSDSPAFRRFVNLSWLPALLGPVVSLVSLALFPASTADDGKDSNSNGNSSSSSSSSDDNNSEMRGAMLLFCLAAALESLAEPAYLICQGCLLTSLRAFSEGAATLARSALTFVLLAWVLPPEQGLIAFGVAQVGYSLVFLAIYWGYLLRAAAGPAAQRDPALRLRSPRHLFPGAPYAAARASSAATGWVDPSELRLSGALTAQSLFKHLLTQGDKIVLALGSSHYSQGLYALAQNYGSLAARLFFQPVEESGRLMFARLAAAAVEEEKEDGEQEEKEKDEQPPPQQPSAASPPARSRKKRGEKAPEVAQEVEAASSRLVIEASSRTTLGLLLGALSKLVVLVGLTFACFGFNYTRVLLRLLLPGKRWEAAAASASASAKGPDASTVLSWYCLYVLLLAVNGITEAFVYATVAQHAEVGAIGLSAGASFAAFAAATAPLMRAFGTVGLVLANSLGMAVRVLCSLLFIRRYFQRAGEPLPDMLPRPAVCAAFLAAFAGTLASDAGTDVEDWGQVLLHVGFGAVAFAGVAATVLTAEQEWLGDLRGIRQLAQGRAGVAPSPGAAGGTITLGPVSAAGKGKGGKAT